MINISLSMRKFLRTYSHVIRQTLEKREDIVMNIKRLLKEFNDNEESII